MLEVRRYWDVARRWLWLAVLGTLVAAGVSYGVSKSLTPVYRAQATLLVNQAQSTQSAVATYNDVLTSERLARTYGELMKKRPVLEQVISDLKLTASYSTLAGVVTVQPVRDTQLVTLSVENTDPQLAADVANAIANTFIAQVVQDQLGQTTASKEILQRQISDLERQIKSTGDAIEQQRRTAGDQPNTRLSLLQGDLAQYQQTYAQLLRSQQDMALAEAKAANNVKLAEPAVRPEKPVRPNVLLNTLIAAAVGLVLTLGVAFLLEYLDDAVKTPELAEAATGLHTLAAVALAGGARTKKNDAKAGSERILFAQEQHSPIAEAFRGLRTNIEFALVDGAARTLMVTSPNPGEGKSTITVNLAIVIAQTGKRVLLIDADLRRPTLHRTFSIGNHQGLTNLLARTDTAIDEVVRTSPFPNLSVMTSGPIPPNPSELLGSNRMEALLAKLSEQFDLVLVDTPPVLAVTDPVVVAPKTDGVVVVVDSAKTSLDALRRTREALGRANANILGIVLNKLTTKSGSYYYYYYRSYYGSKDTATTVPGASSNGHGAAGELPVGGAGR